MNSVIANAIDLETYPVALIWADKAPSEAIRFKSGRWGCVVNVFAAAAAKGRTGVFDRDTFGCWGGGVGLGFGNQYQTFPGGIDGFCRFLSNGNAQSEEGRAVAEKMQASGQTRNSDDFLNGERYLKDPDSTHRFLDILPMRDIPAQFVIVKPLEQVNPENDDIKSVTFFVDPDRLSALVVLANYTNPAPDSVIIPWGAGCQVMGIFAYQELERERPRGLVGMTDLSARKNVRSVLGQHVMSFTAPWPLFREMEANADGSFLQRNTWNALRKHRTSDE
jgi:uncharacterized protein (DUF169 family)